jgi:hypothetical protein
VEKLCNFLCYIAALWSIAGKKKISMSGLLDIYLSFDTKLNIVGQAIRFLCKGYIEEVEGEKTWKKNEINTYNGGGEVRRWTGIVAGTVKIGCDMEDILFWHAW